MTPSPGGPTSNELLEVHRDELALPKLILDSYLLSEFCGLDHCLI